MKQRLTRGIFTQPVSDNKTALSAPASNVSVLEEIWTQKEGGPNDDVVVSSLQSTRVDLPSHEFVSA